MLIRHIGVIALSHAWVSVHAADAIYSKGRLNHSKAHEAYLESDWKPLTRTLEKFLADAGQRSDKVDSAFAYMYLGVIYSADPDTRPRGEARFRKLLTVNPSVDTADFHPLYVSAEVMALFRRLREEYPRTLSETPVIAGLPRGQGMGPAASARGPEGAGAGNRGGGGGVKSGSPSGLKKWVFAGAAGAAVAGGVGTYLFLSRSDAPRGAAIRIPVDL